MHDLYCCGDKFPFESWDIFRVKNVPKSIFGIQNYINDEIK